MPGLGLDTGGDRPGSSRTRRGVSRWLGGRYECRFRRSVVVIVIVVAVAVVVVIVVNVIDVSLEQHQFLRKDTLTAHNLLKSTGNVPGSHFLIFQRQSDVPIVTGGLLPTRIVLVSTRTSAGDTWGRCRHGGKVCRVGFVWASYRTTLSLPRCTHGGKTHNDSGGSLPFYISRVGTAVDVVSRHQSSTTRDRKKVWTSPSLQRYLAEWGREHRIFQGDNNSPTYSRLSYDTLHYDYDTTSFPTL